MRIQITVDSRDKGWGLLDEGMGLLEDSAPIRVGRDEEAGSEGGERGRGNC
jgi:hypothetical protein